MVERCWARLENLDFQSKIEACGFELSNWGGAMVQDFKGRIDKYKQKMQAFKGRRDVVGIIRFNKAQSEYFAILNQ